MHFQVPHPAIGLWVAHALSAGSWLQYTARAVEPLAVGESGRLGAKAWDALGSQHQVPKCAQHGDSGSMNPWFSQGDTKHVRPNWDVRPHPNNTPKRYHIYLSPEDEPKHWLYAAILTI